MDSELWELARAAIAAATARADEYVATGGWTPKVELASVAVFDSGWPNLSTSWLSERDSPVDYSALFGSERGPLKPLAYDDAPALRRFVDYARSRTDLSSRLRIDYMQDQEFADRLLEMEAVDLPLSIMDRAKALGITDSDALQGLYVQRERAWLADRLPVEYVIPLALTPLDLDQVLPLDGSKRLEPLDADTQAARARLGEQRKQRPHAGPKRSNPCARARRTPPG